MKTFCRITSLGLFAAAGIGLAICVGFTADLATSEQESQPPELAAEENGPQDTQDTRPEQERFSPPELRSSPPPNNRVASQPTMTVPSGPAWIEPYPPRTQQVVPEMEKDRLQRVYDLLQEQLAPRSAAAAAASMPPGATAAAPPAPSVPPAAGPPPAAAAPVPEAVAAPAAAAPAPQAAAPTVQGTIDSEGNGRFWINFPNSDIREVLEMLSEQGNLNILASSKVQGKVSATLADVDIDSALDAILKSTGFVAKREGKFIYVGTPEDFQAMEHALDKIGTRVYRPNYVTASELNTLITPLLTEGSGVASVTSPAETGIAEDDEAAGGDNFAGGDALVVRDYEAVLCEIDQVVAEIDVRPMQVHIEAMILSVQLNDGNEFGVNFELLRDNDHAKLGWGSIPEKRAGFEATALNNTVDMATAAAVDGLSRVALDGAGLKFGFLDSSLGAFLNALETVGDTNVIATPRLMVLNKHRAAILIGEKLGYISKTVTETSTTQNVEFLDIGAQLRLRPFISSDGLIRMEVHPELSTGTVKIESDMTIPSKELTQVTTNIMVRDGCTVVIGGLMREELQTTTQQVPLFGSLPVIGPVFRTKKEQLQRREVLVLITPHIVYEPGTCMEGEKAACEFHRRQATYGDKMSPLVGKRSIGRRYFRYAQNAWAAGNRDLALRLVEMSIHFDPSSRAALELRSDIWLGRPQGEHTLGADQPGPPPPSPMDGSTVAPWLLDRLEDEPVVAPAPVHPLDPGRPGSHSDVLRPRRFQ